MQNNYANNNAEKRSITATLLQLLNKNVKRSALFLTFIVCFASVDKGWGQNATNYTFSNAANGSLTSMTGSTQIIAASTNAKVNVQVVFILKRYRSLHLFQNFVP